MPLFYLLLLVFMVFPSNVRASAESQRYMRNALHFYQVGQYDKARHYFTGLLSIGTAQERRVAQDYLKKPELRTSPSKRPYSRPVAPLRRSQFYLDRAIALYQRGDYGGAMNYFDAVMASGTEKQKALAQTYLASPELRDLDLTREKVAVAEPEEEAGNPQRSMHLSGFLQEEMAARYSSPALLSKLRSVGFLALTHQPTESFSWKVSGRLWYDGIFDITHHYPEHVADNQRTDAQLRDTYIDYSDGDWDIRVGKQQIVWGEAVGLFYADVVNAKDLREFVLPDFEFIRIPEWAMDVEYTLRDFHAEGVWLPWPEMSQVGRPGSEFEFAWPPAPGFQTVFAPAQRPAKGLDNGEVGGRLSYRAYGWDWGAFYLRSWDKLPVYTRTLAPGVLTLTETHPRLTVNGATLSKELYDMVIKGEFIYMSGKRFQSVDPASVDGTSKKDVMDYLISADKTFSKSVDTSLQLSQRWIPQYEGHLFQQIRRRTLVTFWLKTRWGDDLEPEALWIQDITRADTMVRPKITWRATTNWRVTMGLDIFNGTSEGLFGQFSRRDRAFAELRYDF